jgi:1,4-dihydroxy-2-naphthoate polyprenyltransferase
MATVKQWVAGARPRTLANSVVPVAVGTAAAFAADSAVWWKAGVALFVAFALQLGVNYANDYSDGVRGTDNERVGPFRLTGSGSAPPRQVLAAAWACFGAAAVAGLVLVLVTAWWLVFLGAAAVAAAWYYTGGSRPYGYRGLGEVAVFVFFGPVAVVGTTFVQTWPEGVPWQTWPAGIAIGLLSCSMLVINNLRDLPSDAEAGKRTLAVMLGEARTRGLFVASIAAAFFAALLSAAGGWWPALVVLCAPLAFPPAARVVRGEEGRELIAALGETGRLQWAFGVLYTLGLALI